MKVFISGLESSEKNIINFCLINNIKIPFLLTSYFYLRKKPELLNKFLMVSDQILIDSGAHSFQKGKKVKWVDYTKQYANFIKHNDSDKIVGYFEMDVDNVIGYDNVLKLRKILENTSKKIIPVWHKNRSIDDFNEICKMYNWVAITGFKNEDILDNQYLQFIKVANKYNTKIHCLGFTRVSLMDKIPFYSVDSSTWKQAGNYGEYRKYKNNKLKIINKKGKFKTQYLDFYNFKEFLKMTNEFLFKERLMNYYYKKNN